VPPLQYTCDGWTLREGMMLGRMMGERWIHTPWTALRNTSTACHTRWMRTLRISSSDSGGERFCTEQTESSASLPSASLSHACHWRPTSSRKLPLSYTEVNQIRPDRDSLLGVDLHVGWLIHKCIWYIKTLDLFLRLLKKRWKTLKIANFNHYTVTQHASPGKPILNLHKFHITSGLLKT